MEAKVKKQTPAGARRIELTQGQYAVIDAEDYERIARHKWYAARNRKNGDYYAYRGRKKSDGKGPAAIAMHREILNAPADMQTHHRNHITLDNRRCNIEIVTAMENLQASLKTKRPTTSRYKGVSRHSEDYADGCERWQTQISYGGDRKRHHLGTFRSEVMAAREYDRASREHHGRFSEPNFKEFVRRANMEDRLEEARGRFFLMYVKLSRGPRDGLEASPEYIWLACQYSKGEQQKHVHFRDDEENVCVRDIRRDRYVLVKREAILALQIAGRNVLVV